MRRTKILDRRVIHPNRVLFHEGEPPRGAFLIECGNIEIIRNEGLANEVRLAVLGPGEVVGEMGLIDGAPRSATARALDTVTVTALDDRAVEQLIARAEPGLAGIVRVLMKRLRAADDALCAGDRPTDSQRSAA
ncbi:MAG: cyclic nucleotide-binding domain-containing protein [Alphaproteobacteria bacterium]|nr:cyclic nucleotide-binding domain-containing protein [Alphaproteobacteria bacterium]